MRNRWVISWLVIDYWRWWMSNRWVIEAPKFCGLSITHRWHRLVIDVIGPLQDPVTWYGINYTGTQMTQWDFENKGKSGWTGKDSFVLKVPVRHLRNSVIYSLPCDRDLQRAYWLLIDDISITHRLLYCARKTLAFLYHLFPFVILLSGLC